MSFSVDSSVAKQFAEGGSNLPQLFPVLLQIPSGDLKRGVNVDEFSGFEGDEKEIIVGGDFVITGIRAMTWFGKNRFNNYNDFETLWKDLGWEEPWNLIMSGESYNPKELKNLYYHSKTNPSKMIFIIKIKQVN